MDKSKAAGTGTMWSKTDLDVWDGVTVLLHDCTHLAGIVLGKESVVVIGV